MTSPPAYQRVQQEHHDDDEQVFKMHDGANGAAGAGVAAGGPPSAPSINVHSVYRNDPAAHDALLRKVTLRLMPFLLVLYTCSFLDRSNLGNVQTPLMRDLGLSISQYGTAASIFFVPYVLLEVPSNMILERVDARRWLARIVTTWGAIATLMTFIHSFEALVVARLLLGVAEAGFFPGIIFYLTQWFTPRERAQRLAFVFVAQPLSGILGGLLAYPILTFCDGMLGLEGWRWVFLIEGTPTVVLGIVTWYYLPANPSEALFLSGEERHFLGQRMRGVSAHGDEESDEHTAIIQADGHEYSRASSRSRGNSGASDTPVTDLSLDASISGPGSVSIPSAVRSEAACAAASDTALDEDDEESSYPSRPRSLCGRLVRGWISSRQELGRLFRSTLNRRVLHLCILCNFLILMPVQAISFYLPAIVGEVGLGPLAGNALSAGPYCVAAVAMFVVSASSDKRQERVWHIIACNVVGLVCMGLTAHTLGAERGPGGPSTALIAVQLVFLSGTAAGVWACKPALMALFTGSLQGNIAVAIAAVTTVGNVSGIVAPKVMSALRAQSGNYSSGCYFLMACLVAASFAVHALGREVERQAVIAARVRRSPDDTSVSVDVLPPDSASRARSGDALIAGIDRHHAHEVDDDAGTADMDASAVHLSMAVDHATSPTRAAASSASAYSASQRYGSRIN